jgi:hypothetical protein
MRSAVNWIGYRTTAYSGGFSLRRFSYGKGIFQHFVHQKQERAAPAAPLDGEAYACDKGAQLGLHAPFLRNETMSCRKVAGPHVCNALVRGDQKARCKRAVGCPTAKNLSYPNLPWAILEAMNPLASFAFLIATVQSLAAAVTTRDNLHIRPTLASKAVAARLVSGMRLLRAFLRRLIILIALEMEWHLVDTRGEMKRPHGRKTKSSAGFALGGLEANKVSPWLNRDGPQFNTAAKQTRATPISIDMTRLYAQLDFLAQIAANPIVKAKRLAFHLARKRHGIIMAPQGPPRIAGRWGTEVSASFDAMAASIITQSRNRPPPLPPPRNQWPTITVF